MSFSSSPSISPYWSSSIRFDPWFNCSRFHSYVFKPEEVLLSRYHLSLYCPMPSNGSSSDDRALVTGELFVCSQTLVFVPLSADDSILCFSLEPGFTVRTSKTKRFPVPFFQAFALTSPKLTEIIFRSGRASGTRTIKTPGEKKFGILSEFHDNAVELLSQLREITNISRAEVVEMIIGIRKPLLDDTTRVLSNRDVVQLYGKQVFRNGCVDGRILVNRENLFLIPFASPTRRTSIIPLTSITRVLRQLFLLREIRIEIFTVDGESFLLELDSEERQSSLFEALRTQAACRKRIEDSKDDLHRATEDWVQGRLSNFNYLLFCNQVASRSLHDLYQYPVFPWVLVDYDSTVLNLEDPQIFRNLSQPIGTLNVDRFEKLERHRHDGLSLSTTEKDILRTHSLNASTSTSEPAHSDVRVEDSEGNFLYRTLYSHYGAVADFLVRDYPELHLSFHEGKFDHKDRIFSSIKRLWQSVNVFEDFRELIPEFFSGSGSFLVNDSLLPLSDSSSHFGHVDLPQWASSPEEFTYLHRAALESEYVSSHLHEWIDLIFGCKQRGEEAVASHNLFFSTHARTPQHDSDRECLLHYGQLPRQIFFEPHPQRITQILNVASVSDIDFVSREECDVLETELASSRTLCSSLEDSCVRLREEVSTLKELQQSSERSLEDALQRVHAFEQEIPELREKNRDLLVQISNLENDNETVTFQLTEKIQEIEQMEKEFTEQRRTLEKKLSNVRKRLSQVSDPKYLSRLEEQVRDLSRTEKSLLDALRRTEHDNQELQRRLSMTLEHKENLESLYISHKKQEGTLEERRVRLNSLRAELTRLQDELDRSEYEKKNQKKEMSDLKEEVRRLDLTVHSLDQQICVQETLLDLANVDRAATSVLPLPGNTTALPTGDGASLFSGVSRSSGRRSVYSNSPSPYPSMSPRPRNHSSRPPSRSLIPISSSLYGGLQTSNRSPGSLSNTSDANISRNSPRVPLRSPIEDGFLVSDGPINRSFDEKIDPLESPSPKNGCDVSWNFSDVTVNQEDRTVSPLPDSYPRIRSPSSGHSRIPVFSPNSIEKSTNIPERSSGEIRFSLNRMEEDQGCANSDAPIEPLSSVLDDM